MSSPPKHPTPTPAKPATAEPLVTGKPPIVLVETAFLASTASLLWLLNVYFPIGPALQVFFPIPIALIYLRWGQRAGWMTAIVAGLLLSILMGPTRSLLFLIPYGIMGIHLGACWRRQASWLTSISLGALIECFGIFFRFWLTSTLLGEDLWVYAIARIRDIAEWLFIQFGILAEPSLVVIQCLMLGLVLFQCLIYVFVVHLVALLLFERLGNPIPKAPRWVEVLMDL